MYFQRDSQAGQAEVMSGLLSYSSMEALWIFVYQLYHSFINYVGSRLLQHLHFAEIKVGRMSWGHSLAWTPRNSQTNSSKGETKTFQFIYMLLWSCCKCMWDSNFSHIFIYLYVYIRQKWCSCPKYFLHNFMMCLVKQNGKKSDSVVHRQIQCGSGWDFI